MGISWLKLYEIEEMMAGRWGYGVKYYQETSREHAVQITTLKPIKITFKGLDPNCKIAPIDNMHVRCLEFWCNPNSIWWSHKFNGPGVWFEVVSNPTDGGMMLSASGLYPSSLYDLTIFGGGKKKQQSKWRKSSLYHHLPDTLKVTITMDTHSPKAKKTICSNEVNTGDMLQ